MVVMNYRTAFLKKIQFSKIFKSFRIFISMYFCKKNKTKYKWLLFNKILKSTGSIRIIFINKFNPALHLLLFISFGYPTISFSQSLPELFATARQQNPQLKAIELEYQSILEQLPQVSQMPDPEAGIGFFPMPVETRLGPQRLRLSVTQMLPWKGTLPAKREVVTATANAAKEKTQAQQIDLFYHLKKAYFNLYELSEKQRIILRNIRIYQSFEQLALAKMKSGNGSLADALRAQLKIKELENKWDLLEIKKVKPTANLNQILNRSPEMEIVISDSLLFTEIPFAKNDLIKNMEASHPDLIIFSLRQEIAQKNIQLNKLNGKPTLGVGLDYIFVGQRSDADPEHNGRDILMPRASLRIPFHQEKYAAKTREEELKINAFQLQKEALLNEFEAIIESAYAEQKEAATKLKLYDTQEQTLRSAIEILASDYSTSGKGFDEILELQNELINYDLLRLQAIVQSQMARAVVERFVKP